jgi:PAS domain S-box-containing protein
MNTLKANGEKKFIAIFKYAAVGIFIVDAKGMFSEVNEAFCNMVGYGEEELKTIYCNEISHPDDKHLHMEFFTKMSTGELEQYYLEKRFIHSSGNIVYVKLTFSAINDEDGKFIYSVAVVENVTPQKKAEMELENVLSNIILDWNIHDTEREVDRKKLKTVVSNMVI